jgi:hypothetical protein
MKNSLRYPVSLVVLLAFLTLGASEGAEVGDADLTVEAAPPRSDSPTVEEPDDPEARTEESSVNGVSTAEVWPGRQVEGRVAARDGVGSLTSKGFTLVTYFYRLECDSGYMGDICRSRPIHQIIYIWQPPPGTSVADAIAIVGVQPVYEYQPPGAFSNDGSVPPERMITWPLPSADANYDLKINILDMIFVRNRLGQDPESGDNWKADVHPDGSIDILDMLLVRYYLNNNFEGRTWYPDEYPW